LNRATIIADLGLDVEQIAELRKVLCPTAEALAVFDATAPLGYNGMSMSPALVSRYIEHGKHAGLQIGPVKGHARAEAKVSEYAAEENETDDKNLAGYITDWVRGRIVCASPLALAAAFWYLQLWIPELRVVRCKNKLLKPPANNDHALNIHLNVEFDVQGETHIAEIQLLLEAFLIAKDLSHKYYEYHRATQVHEILGPVFPPSSKAEVLPQSITVMETE